ncbi:MAG: hypothetical protein HDQ87_05910 [Clostridia bacterium]|nr:hypothetical protein [Clostridia bacterium]
MAYRLESISFRVDGGAAGGAATEAIWNDLVQGKLPLLFDSDGQFVPGLSPVTEYRDFDGRVSSLPCSMTIRAVPGSFFQQMADQMDAGLYKLYTAAGSDIAECSAAVWKMFSEDEDPSVGNVDDPYAVESSVPTEYTKDGKAHSYLWVKRHFPD